MKRENKTVTRGRRVTAAGASPAPKPARQGIKLSDLRRNTYRPGREPGVHARELGITGGKSA